MPHEPPGEHVRKAEPVVKKRPNGGAFWIFDFRIWMIRRIYG